MWLPSRQYTFCPQGGFYVKQKRISACSAKVHCLYGRFGCCGVPCWQKNRVAVEDFVEKKLRGGVRSDIGSKPSDNVRRFRWGYLLHCFATVWGFLFKGCLVCFLFFCNQIFDFFDKNCRAFKLSFLCVPFYGGLLCFGFCGDFTFCVYDFIVNF